MEDEEEDGFTDKEEDLGAVEEERSVILHLLSQLKLGMDLTRVGRVPRHRVPVSEQNRRNCISSKARNELQWQLNPPKDHICALSSALKDREACVISRSAVVC